MSRGNLVRSKLQEVVSHQSKPYVRIQSLPVRVKVYQADLQIGLSRSQMVNSRMKPGEFLTNMEIAIAETYRNDRDLIGLRVNERALAHRFALYMEPLFKGWNIDCEYNRYGDELGPKTLSGIEGCERRKETDWIVPDILIHKRRSKDKENLAVFEIKSESALDNCDRLKLKGMTSQSGRFKYEYGIGVEFRNDSCRKILFTDGTPRREFASQSFG